MTAEASLLLYLMAAGEGPVQIYERTRRTPKEVSTMQYQLHQFFGARNPAHLITRAYLAGYLTRAQLQAIDAEINGGSG